MPGLSGRGRLICSAAFRPPGLAGGQGDYEHMFNLGRGHVQAAPTGLRSRVADALAIMYRHQKIVKKQGE